MSKLLLIAAVASMLGGCATTDLSGAVTLHNTARALGAITQQGLQAELTQGLYYAR
jgi:hypothetical protein